MSKCPPQKVPLVARALIASRHYATGCFCLGAALVLARPATGRFDYSGVAQGSAVQIDTGTNSGFIECITSGNTTAYPVSLLLGNGTEVFIHPELKSNLTATYALTVRNGLQIRFRDFSERDEGEYICVTVDGNDMPLNQTFTLFSGS